MKTKKSIFKKRTSLARALVTAVSAIAVASILLANAGCQSTKVGAENSEVGANVQMAELRQVIQTRVSDPARSTAMLGLVSNAERELGDLNLEYLKFRQKYGKLTANHSKTAEDLNAVLRESEAKSSAGRLRLTNVMLDMKQHSTPQEWPSISNAFLNSVLRDSDRYQDNNRSAS